MAMEMRGSLNVSKYYTKPNQPKWYGKALIDGKEYVIKAWEKDGPNGAWISLYFEESVSEQEALKRREEEFAPTPKKEKMPRPHQSDGDIPF